jgi:hypothetical protein
LAGRRLYISQEQPAAVPVVSTFANPFLPRPAIQQGADGNMYVAGVRTGVPSVQTSIGLDGRVHVNPSFQLPVPVSGTQTYSTQLQTMAPVTVPTN